MNYAFLTFFLLINVVGHAIINPDSLTTHCKRNLLIKTDKILVTIHIQKPNSSGFARIYEKLPIGSEASNINCGTAVFKNEKSMLKIAWDEIPNVPWIEISYELKLKNAIPDTALAINGTFSAEFLPAENDQISIVPGTKEYFKKEPELVVKTENLITEKKEHNFEKKETKLETNSALISSNGVYICIQVAAVGKDIQSDYLKKQFGFEGEFEAHFEENIYRITVGKFTSKAEAEAVLNDYKSKYFKKCFLSAYKNGHKIPVYEAEKLLN